MVPAEVEMQTRAQRPAEVLLQSRGERLNLQIKSNQSWRSSGARHSGAIQTPAAAHMDLSI